MDAWNEEDLRAWASGSEAGCKNIEGGEDGAPDGIRTHDPCLRRAVLYPAELLVQRGRHDTHVGGGRPLR